MDTGRIVAEYEFVRITGEAPEEVVPVSPEPEENPATEVEELEPANV